eukprot:1437018-Lingulodinium_polyedra.AAC.1
MAAPATTRQPSSSRALPSKVIMSGVSVPKHPRLPPSPDGTVPSSPCAIRPRGRRRRLRPPQVAQRVARQSHAA